MGLRIYFDCCALQRPFDAPTQIRIALESEAMLRLIELVELGNIELVGSQALDLEIQAMPFSSRRTYCEILLKQASYYATVSDKVKILAKYYETRGIKGLDALHLACAVEAQAAYLCTCDDSFLRKAQSERTLLTRVYNIVELAREIKL